MACEDGCGWVCRWLSPERFSPYLEACGGDVDAALALYEWNIALGQVLLHDMAHFEVALRNSYDAVMSRLWEGREHWLVDEASPVRRPIMRRAKAGELDLNRISRKAIDSARSGLPADAPPGRLVSSLTLGFWVHLTDRSREAEVWRTGLYLAWPRGTDRKVLHGRLSAILRLRNRVAHHERLFNPRSSELSPVEVDRAAVELFAALCPEAAARVCPGDTTPVERFLEDNPAPAGVVV